MIEWEKKYPNRKEIMMTAMSNIHASHLFDPTMFDFEGLEELVKK
jgi:hypothetical protein